MFPSCERLYLELLLAMGHNLFIFSSSFEVKSFLGRCTYLSVVSVYNKLKESVIGKYTYTCHRSDLSSSHTLRSGCDNKHLLPIRLILLFRCVKTICRLDTQQYGLFLYKLNTCKSQSWQIIHAPFTSAKNAVLVFVVPPWGGNTKI